MIKNFVFNHSTAKWTPSPWNPWHSRGTCELRRSTLHDCGQPFHRRCRS